MISAPEPGPLPSSPAAEGYLPPAHLPKEQIRYLEPPRNGAQSSREPSPLQPASQPQWVYDATAAAGLSFPPGCFICHLIWCQIKVIYRERACISCDILIKNASCLCTSHYRLNLTQRIAVDSEIRLRHLKALAHPSPCIRVMSMARGKSRSKILKAVSKHLAGRSPAALEASLYLG